LYFSTTHRLQTAWDDQCDFSGNGDGTLFYPGSACPPGTGPGCIGGSTDIPIESIRLKRLRDGREDYEYLRLAAAHADTAAHAEPAGDLARHYLRAFHRASRLAVGPGLP
ncbi:MAG: DUF4091 domain-containing protein, partial [Thermomicrobiales bacterium]|nr:DUF4091 domain-containing protein [Thermomicrobiales bacterium]